MIVWVLASLAFAQQEICGEPYSRIQFGAAVGQVDDAYRNNDVREAKALLQKAGDDLRCHNEVIDRLLLSKFTRYMSLQFFFDQDEEGAKRWGATSLGAGEELPYDARIFPPTFVELMRDMEEPVLGGPGSGLAVPSGGGIFIDGVLVLEPVIAAEIPHFVQVFDKNQALLGAYWQTGAAFEEGVLGTNLSPKPPKWWTGDGASSARNRARAEEGGKSVGNFPLVPVVAVGGLLLASGASYLVASSAAARLPDAKNGGELTAARTEANAFVVISGVCLAGAVGVGVGGVLVSHDGIVFNGRF